MKRTPGNPATWSACICVRQIAPSCRKPQPSDFQGICVPSPQSNSVSVDPQRIKTDESQCPGKGIMPHVPGNKDRSCSISLPIVTNYFEKPTQEPPPLGKV